MHLSPNSEAGLAMIVKQRAKANLIESMDLVGTVENCDVIIVVRKLSLLVSYLFFCCCCC